MIVIYKYPITTYSHQIIEMNEDITFVYLLFIWLKIQKKKHNISTYTKHLFINLPQKITRAYPRCILNI